MCAPIAGWTAPYGEFRAGSLRDITDFGFTGQTLDRSTDGLMYYGARYYLPGLRRFISSDTIMPGPGNPQVYNRYVYTNNNPLKYIDPSGHAVCDPNMDVAIPECDYDIYDEFTDELGEYEVDVEFADTLDYWEEVALLEIIVEAVENRSSCR